MRKLSVGLLFCSLAVLDPRVGNTTDVLSPFISVLWHSDWLFHGESCPRLFTTEDEKARLRSKYNSNEAEQNTIK